jgi:hypothetical protein
LLEQAVRAHDPHTRDDQAGLRHLADDERGAGVDNAREIDQAGPRVADLRQESLIRPAHVDALVGHDLETDALRSRLEDVGDPLTVEFPIVEDEHLVRTETFRPPGSGCALDVVGG